MSRLNFGAGDPSLGFYYRFDTDLVSAGVDEFDNSLGPPSVVLRLAKFPIVKITPKGVRLNVFGTTRFVLNEARKRYALPTIELAKESFLARKKRRISLLQGSIDTEYKGIRLIHEQYPDKVDPLKGLMNPDEMKHKGFPLGGLFELKTTP